MPERAKCRDEGAVVLLFLSAFVTHPFSQYRPARQDRHPAHPQSIQIHPQCPMFHFALQPPPGAHDCPLHHPHNPEDARIISKARVCTKLAQLVNTA